MRELLSAVFKTGCGSAVSLSLGMLSMKIMAVVLGPSGVGLFSLLRQTQQTALTIAVLNGQMAIVQGTASREEKERANYLATVLGILTLTGSSVSLGVLIFAPWLTYLVIGQNDVVSIYTVRWLSLSIFFSTAGAYLTSLLNGYRAIIRVALVQITNFGLMACMAYPSALLVKSGYTMALSWLLAASALASLCLGLWFALRSNWLIFLFDRTNSYFSLSATKHFLGLAGTMLVTGFFGTAIPLAVRSLTAHRFGLQGAGIFDVAWTLSMAYATLILTSFSTYYLPTLSQTQGLKERQNLVYQVLRLSIFVMVPLVVTVVGLKPLAVEILYTSEFLNALDIMRYMLIGDYFKVISWVLSFTMIAYADMKTYLWTELFWGGLMLGGSALSILAFESLQGIGICYIILYITYFIFVLIYVIRKQYLTLEKKVVLQWLIGLALVISVSLDTWEAETVNWIATAFWLAVSLLFTWIVLNYNERKKIIRIIITFFTASTYR